MAQLKNVKTKNQFANIKIKVISFFGSFISAIVNARGFVISLNYFGGVEKPFLGDTLMQTSGYVGSFRNKTRR